MALTDTQVFIPGTGSLWIAPAGTAVPADLEAPDGAWENLGHTSRDDGIGITRDGGDSEVLGSWQNPVLRERRDPVTFAITANLLQFSNETLELYFGGGDKTVAGKFGVPLTATPQERALYILIQDGERYQPIYIEKCSIASDDDVDLGDVEAFVQFPIRATVLGVTGHNLMEFYGDHLGLLTNEVQQVAITGTPTGGTFTLTFDGDTTSSIAYNANAAAVKTALAALDSVDGTDNIDTAGGPLPGTPVTVTFKGAFADTNVPAMTASGAGLTGGTSPAVAITTTTPGG